MDDDTIIRSKLSVDEKSLQRLTKRFSQWSANLFKETDEEFDKGMNSVLLELSQVELRLQHAQLVAAMTFREREHYHKEQQQIEDQVQAAQQELTQLEQQLEEAKKERSNKIQYDELATEINKFPTREQSMQQIEHLRREIGELEDESMGYEHMLEWRKKQFLAAWVALQGIQESIAEDRKEEERLLALKINRRFENREGVAAAGGLGVGIGGLGGLGGMPGDGSDSEDEDFDEKVRAQQQEQQEEQKHQQLQPSPSSSTLPSQLQQDQGHATSSFDSGVHGTTQSSSGGETAMEMDVATPNPSSSAVARSPRRQGGGEEEEEEEEEEGATLEEDDNYSGAKMAVDEEIGVTPQQSPSHASSLAGSPFIPGTPRISRTDHSGEEGGVDMHDDDGHALSGQSSARPTPSPMGSQVDTPTFGSPYEPGDASGLFSPARGNDSSLRSPATTPGGNGEDIELDQDDQQ